MPLILSGSAGLSGNVGNVTKDMLPAGSVLQVVQVSKTDTAVVTGSSFQDIPGLVVSITPMSLTSKILVNVNLSCLPTSPGYHGAMARLARNGTHIFISDATDRGRSTVSLYRDSDGDGNTIKMYNVSYLDSPNSVAAVTYSLQVADVNSSAEPIYINRSQTDATGGVHPRATSSIILMEIKA